jgi:hypothetical protein
MARSAPMWWPWVQMRLDERGWIPADLAREIRKLGFVGPDESAIGRWKNKGSAPTRESVRAVTAVFHCDRDAVRKAKIAAGLVTADDLDAPWPDLSLLDAPWPDLSRIDLTAVPDEALAEQMKELADEVAARLVRGHAAHRQSAPSANGASRTPIAPTGPGSRHVVPADAETAPPLSEESERGVNADCA